MKLLQSLLIVVCLVPLLLIPVMGQNPEKQCCVNPDSLTIITVSGTAIVDSDYNRDIYYIDEDGDDLPDYRLNFGPYWYEPEDETLTRPENGDPITVTGGLYECPKDCVNDTLAMIIVYELNDETWRDPYCEDWNYAYNKEDSCFWRDDSLDTLNVSGTVLVDSTFRYLHYYLDVDGDTWPDYFLNFGPPWFEPVDPSISLPQEGDYIEVFGVLVPRDSLDMIIVSEIDGLVWNDLLPYKRQFGGKWMHRNMIQNQYVHTPFDTCSGFTVSPGWHNGDAKLPDSIFCMMTQTHMMKFQNAKQEKAFAAYQIQVMAHNRMNLMTQNQGESLNLASEVQFKFHYNDAQLNAQNMSGETIAVKAWNGKNSQWEDVTGVYTDTESQIVSFTSSTIFSKIILTSTEDTAVETEKIGLEPAAFQLTQNYPNPFNPVTSIKFTLPEQVKVLLEVYNTLGQKMVVLVNNQAMSAGPHLINFDASNLPSGVYFYRINAGRFNETRKMVVLR